VKLHASYRLFRSGLIGSILLGLAAGGHLAGGGQLPAPAILAALCAVTMVPVSALARFRLSFPVLAALIGAGQIWLHGAFDALSGHVPLAGPSSLVSGHAGRMLAPPDHQALVLSGPAHGSGPDGLMIAAHAIATLITALLLARRERALCAVDGWLTPLLQSLGPALIIPARGPVPSAATKAISPAHHSVRLPALRGPPMLTGTP